MDIVSYSCLPARFNSQVGWAFAELSGVSDTSLSASRGSFVQFGESTETSRHRVSCSVASNPGPYF